MQYGWATTMDNYALLEQCGYDYIELGGMAVAAMNKEQLQQACSTLAAGGAKCRNINSYCGPDVVVAGPGFDLTHAREYAKMLMERAQMLGASMVGVGAPKSRTLPEGYDRELALRQAVEFFQATGEVAQEHGITVLVEPVCSLECNFMTTTAQGVEMVQRVGRDNVRMVYDIYHAYAEGEDVAPIAQAGPYLCHVHICDKVGKERHYLREENLPLYRKYLDAIRQTGYDQVVSIEAFVGDVQVEAKKSLSILRMAL